MSEVKQLLVYEDWSPDYGLRIGVGSSAVGFGAEYRFSKRFFARGGYSLGEYLIENRNDLTLGIGAELGFVRIDLSAVSRPPFMGPAFFSNFRLTIRVEE
ncbi:MAG: hypothetical protein ACC655_06405 [Rhodothermia bacterium]